MSWAAGKAKLGGTMLKVLFLKSADAAVVVLGHRMNYDQFVLVRNLRSDSKEDTVRTHRSSGEDNDEVNSKACRMGSRPRMWRGSFADE